MMRIRWALLAALAVWILTRAVPIAARQPDTGFLNRTANLDGVTYKYEVFVPDNWNKGSRWPVILFMHGFGEEGSDGLLQTQEGLPAAIRNHVDRFPFVVVMPQCRKNDWWLTSAMEAQALKALDRTMREFKGDPQRVYLTGLSMGGFATWALAAKYPKTFAAIVPVCGGIHPTLRLEIQNYRAVEDSPDPYTATAAKIGKTPVWIFHGADDDTVPVEESRKMAEALRAAGGDVRYTEYPGIKHNSWDKAYATPELTPWLLDHKLSAAN